MFSQHKQLSEKQKELYICILVNDINKFKFVLAQKFNCIDDFVSMNQSTKLSNSFYAYIAEQDIEFVWETLSALEKLPFNQKDLGFFSSIYSTLYESYQKKGSNKKPINNKIANNVADQPNNNRSFFNKLKAKLQPKNPLNNTSQSLAQNMDYPEDNINEVNPAKFENHNNLSKIQQELLDCIYEKDIEKFKQKLDGIKTLRSIIDMTKKPELNYSFFNKIVGSAVAQHQRLESTGAALDAFQVFEDVENDINQHGSLEFIDALLEAFRNFEDIEGIIKDYHDIIIDKIHKCLKELNNDNELINNFIKNNFIDATESHSSSFDSEEEVKITLLFDTNEHSISNFIRNNYFTAITESHSPSFDSEEEVKITMSFDTNQYTIVDFIKADYFTDTTENQSLSCDEEPEEQDNETTATHVSSSSFNNTNNFFNEDNRIPENILKYFDPNKHTVYSESYIGDEGAMFTL